MELSNYPHPYLKDIFQKFTRWKQWEKIEPEGFIIGCNWKMQAMIPWWWEHYSKYNALPVTFIDMGLSDTMRHYCERRGRVAPLLIPKYLLKKRILLPEQLKEKHSTKALRKKNLERFSYFFKPFALLQSPYQHSVWIDIDCRVQASLSPIFDYCKNGIALTPMSPYKQLNPAQQQKPSDDQVLFNSGVICFQRGDALINDWTVASVCRDQWYFGDQDILNALIYEQRIEVNRLPNTYNWIVKEWGQNPEAKVVHFAGLFKSFNHHRFSSFNIQMPKKPYHW